MTDKEDALIIPTNTDEWSRRAMENMNRMSTDETYRQHIVKLSLGDAAEWRKRRRDLPVSESKDSQHQAAGTADQSD